MRAAGDVGDQLAHFIREAVREEVRTAFREVLKERGAGTSEWLSREAVAEMLGVSVRTVTNYIAQGLDVHYVGSLPRFKRIEVEAWIERNSRKLRRVK